MKIIISTTGATFSVVNEAGTTVLDYRIGEFAFSADANGLAALAPEILAAFNAAKQAICEADAPAALTA